MKPHGHIDNLLSLFNEATTELKQEAMRSYQRYHDLCYFSGKQFGCSVETAAGVFAALSPNNDYVGNLRDMNKLLKAHRHNQTLDSFTVTTYGNNKRKAWAIVKGESPFLAITALKTRNFFFNILDPQDQEHVTVDGHMFWAWMGRRGRLTAKRDENNKPDKIRLNVANVTPKIYHAIALDLFAIARKFRILPNQVQAIIWQQYRIRHNIMRQKQRELIPSDCLVVGMHENFLPL